MRTSPNVSPRAISATIRLEDDPTYHLRVGEGAILGSNDNPASGTQLILSSARPADWKWE